MTHSDVRHPALFIFCEVNTSSYTYTLVSKCTGQTITKLTEFGHFHKQYALFFFNIGVLGFAFVVLCKICLDRFGLYFSTFKN